ncbi:PARP-domain-containing protein [Rhizoclosmatium globosum]|uniref:Poly [ADP-ribose] polymerase n=1 Tax=Rhizoclosmatium globosum TaxID=329046 RepID=A0A1Y2BD24_9FUNG|nr:PARP-domain-containing protein [Rhizoclosmatium globosum]|eukprot:ORY32440.1 PARP-domain-containing protein [Rhizoclosmatium globosum]
MPPKRKAAPTRDASPTPAPAPPTTTRTTRRSAAASAAQAQAQAPVQAQAPAATAAAVSPSPPKKSRRAPPKSSKKKDEPTADQDDKEEDKVDDKKEDKEEEEEKEEEEKEEEQLIVKAIKKGKAPVDSGAPGSITSSYHVLEKDGIVYDALLNQTNINANNNKFYVIQVLKHDSQNTYIAWNRWGRVGAGGQTASPAFNNPDDAIHAFEKKFLDKTKNHWDNRSNFVKHSGKYHLLERDWGDDDTEEALAGVESSKEEPIKYPDSKLDPAVQDLVKLIFNLEVMEREMTEIGYDAKKMPLGKLTKKTIQEGYLELKKISEELSKPRPNSTILAELSSAFYSIIPHNFGMRTPESINTAPKLNAKLRMVEALGDIQITTTLLSSKLDRTVNPVDGKFSSLNIGMTRIDKSSDVFELVERYTKNTHGHTHSSYKLAVEEVFELEKSDQFDEFGKSLHNHKLLWHGSRLSNFVGILSQGLRIAPPEAPVTGYMFGKGVYFADMVSKSANYCFTSPSNNTGLLLLCEVALGDENELYQSSYHADEEMRKNKKHSTWGKGRTKPDPSGSVTLPNGVVVPCGKGVRESNPNCALEYNEFICYDLKQVRLKYLVKMRFDYGR